MADVWCDKCKFGEIDGADEPCISCISDGNGVPTEFVQIESEAYRVIKALQMASDYCKAHECYGCGIRLFCSDNLSPPEFWKFEDY